MADLLKPILDNGIQSTNFFNGRLVMAEDLQTEQTAHRQQHQELGRAIGDGVVYGLMVQPVTSTPAPPQPTVSVSAGLAITRSGRAILLPTDQQVALVASSDSSVPGLDSCGRNTIFVECSTFPTSSFGNPGLYVLTAMPTSGLSSALAPMAELGSGGIGTACGSKYSIEGVQFRLVAVNLSGAPGSLRDQLTTSARQTALSGGALYKLRNGLANACYGTDLVPSFAQNPFNTVQGDSPFVSFGLLDDLRSQSLISNCEVPLALVYWTAAGIRFIDLWSVRRRCAPRLLDDLWPLMLDSRRVSDAEANFLQFQDQITAMAASQSNLPQIRASDYFYYLPAGGFLPIGTSQYTTASFFAGFTVHNLTTDAAMLHLLLHESLYMDPIDFNDKPILRLYTVDGTSGWVLFVRKPKWKRIIPASAERGAINIEIAVQAFTGAAPRLPASVQIIAQSATVKARRIAASFDGSTHRPLHQDFTYLYDLGNLPFDTYSIDVSAKGYTSSGAQQVVVNSTARLTLRFTLAMRTASQQRNRPSLSRAADWVNPGWYGKVYMVDSEYSAVWPPKTAAQTKWQDAGDPPQEIQPWLKEWANYLSKRNPAAAGVTNVRLVRDPAHTPAVTYDQPYAWVVFGDAGGAMPVLLTAKDQTLAHPTTTVGAAVPGIDAGQDATGLQTFGLHNVDALAAAWKGLVARALNISHPTAATIIAAAQNRAASIAGTVSMFSGVDANTVAVLARQNITTAVDLANADPTKLATGDISLAQAERIVDEARNAVPREAWSLDSPALGLSEQARASLQRIGITTLGAFNDAATADITKAGVASTLGITPDQLTNIAQSGLAQKTAVAVAHKVGAPATSVFGVGSSTAVELAKAGFATAGKLAAADPQTIAKFFGGDAQKADYVIASAKKLIG